MSVQGVCVNQALPIGGTYLGGTWHGVSVQGVCVSQALPIGGTYLGGTWHGVSVQGVCVNQALPIGGTYLGGTWHGMSVHEIIALRVRAWGICPWTEYSPILSTCYKLIDRQTHTDLCVQSKVQNRV